MAHRPQSSPLIIARAREMRFALTSSEEILWRELKGSRLGVAFRRQVPLGRYIVDFYAPRVRLAVEVDGGYHRRRVAADARRDRFLARAGCRVLRLEAELVCSELEVAGARVREALEGCG